MKKWLWPGLTWTVALTALALWFGIDHVEDDIATRTAEALAPYVWTSFDIDGRDVTVKGMAPDPQMQASAHSALTKVWGVGTITDLTNLLPVAEPYIFTVTKSGEGLVLSGSIPDNTVRDRLMAVAGEPENASVDDELALARGSPPAFADMALFALELAKSLKDGRVEISGLRLSIKGKAADHKASRTIEAKLLKPLPFALQLATVDVEEH
ncbi:hypothetical protein H7Q97_05110 [Ochrobactrum sp. CM-21-5]|nr:hypothetical protein [Ochrobactrum sp. CM-21-5]MBC2884781.1 hypothetical protein [Ochrobactrum sp. CM-21-5]